MSLHNILLHQNPEKHSFRHKITLQWCNSFPNATLSWGKLQVSCWQSHLHLGSTDQHSQSSPTGLAQFRGCVQLLNGTFITETLLLCHNATHVLHCDWYLPSLLPLSTTSGDGVCCEREPKESRLSKESSLPWRGGERESLRSESQQSI